MKMKTVGLRCLARISAWLALFCGMLIIYLSFVLFDFFPPAVAGVRVYIYLLNFAGMALGAALCPLFLPLPFLPSREALPEVPGEVPPALKSPWISAAFIFLVILPNIVVRSLGVSFWLGSTPARILLALSSGMVQPTACGLFYLTWLQPPSPPQTPNRTGPYASFLLAVAMMAAVIIRGGTIPLLEHFGLAAEPMRAMTLLFYALRWTALCLGLSAVVCVFALGKEERMNRQACQTGPVDSGQWAESPASWKTIARLSGLAVTFFTLNSLVEMRLFPMVSGAVGTYKPFFPVVVPAVLLLGFLAGRSALFVEGKTGPFLRLLLIPMIVLFILLPALYFLNDEYPFFALALNSLVVIAHFSVWVIFTTAIVELYRGQRFFYACASAVFMMYCFAFLGPLLGPVIPKDPGFMTLVSAVAAVLFTLLAFRLLFPGLPLLAEFPAENGPENSGVSLRAIFQEHGLTEREAEVARLMVMEGLSNQKIAERIFRSKFTVEKHVTSMYRKFSVPDRTAFVAKVLRQGTL
jgi:DNA-binding CsgD family transcriptional regulator